MIGTKSERKSAASAMLVYLLFVYCLQLHLTANKVLSIWIDLYLLAAAAASKCNNIPYLSTLQILIIMEQKITIAKMRSAYCKRIESDVRSISSYLRELVKDYADYAANIPASTARAKDAYTYFAAFGMKENHLNLAYIKKWFSGIDSKGRICDYKRIELEAEKEMRAKYPDYDFTDMVTYSVMLVPVNLWTSSKVLAKVAAAVKAEKAAASAAAAAVREQERAEKERAQMERLAAKLAAYNAKVAAAAAAKSESESKSESKSKSRSKSTTAAAAA